MKITIYTITDCQFSKQEKEYLTLHNLPFEEKNLETNHEYLTEMLNVSNNFAGTPVTKLEKDDGTIVVMKGFTKEEFDKELGFTPEEKPADVAKKEEVKPEEQKTEPAKVEAPADKPQQAAPPTEPAAPQPPAPAPVPQVPNIPATPEVPTSPPTVPQTAMPSQPQPIAQAPMNGSAAPDMSAPAESTVDDASLDAILNQLQQKTNTPEAPAAPNPQAAPPNIPDFGNKT